jgi:futalosine hydrolase
MILALAATEIEMSPLRRILTEDMQVRTVITGVGPVETAVRLNRYLDKTEQTFSAVINFGIGGGYIQAAGGTGPCILDLYLAETEVFGDLGICYPDRVEPLSKDLTGEIIFKMDPSLLDRAKKIYGEGDIKTGNFVTVMGVSATLARGQAMAERFQAQCENMEGAAIARVCSELCLPTLELRCISNLVEERNLHTWRLQEACEKAAEAAAELIKNILEYS